MTREINLLEYINLVASSAPTPGGGSVAATTGSLGCALGEMVANISLGRAADRSQETLELATDRLVSQRAKLTMLAEADERAYASYREARALPKSTPDEVTLRDGAVQRSLLVAAEVPLQIAETATEALESLSSIVDAGSKYLLADVATASYLLEAAVKGALENAWVNLNSMTDDSTSIAIRNRAATTMANKEINFRKVQGQIAARRAS